MDQVMWLAIGLYFHSAILVTTSWSCFMPLGPHWFHSKFLFWPPVLVPSHPGLASFCSCWTHSLVLTWLIWNCHVEGICYLYPTPLQITTMWALHFMYNDKVSEIGDVPGGMPEGNHRIVPMKFAVAVPSTLLNKHPSANILPGRDWWGVWKGG